MISLDSAIVKLEPFIPASQSDMLMCYSSALESLVNDSGYSEDIALHLVLFAYAEAMNSELIALAPKPSAEPKTARD